MAFASLKNDYVFKEVFSNERILRRFLSDVTGIPLGKIKSVRVVTPFLGKRFQRQKLGIMDVALIMNDNTRIDIELQIRRQKFWVKRFLFYLAKMYTEDLRFGEDYQKLRKCISISIVDFTLIAGEDYHSVYTLRDRNGREFTDLFEIHILELNKQLKEDDTLGEWLQLFNANTKEKLDEQEFKIAEVQEAAEMVERMSLTRTLRWVYEQKLKARRDRWAEDEYVRDEGRAEGEELRLIRMVCRKLAKGKAVAVIVEELEEDSEHIQKICNVAAKYAPEYDISKIFRDMKGAQDEHIH